jgi:hypothetical protein
MEAYRSKMREVRGQGLKRWCNRVGVAALWAAALCGCASYDGSSLTPGQSTLQDVLATMGQPAAQWTASDHSMRLSYPHGPSGYHSYMVDIDTAGRLQGIHDVMNQDNFNRISRGMAEADVLRTLGPSVPAWTSYFAARRELVLEWHYCNESSQGARFDVLLDGERHDVRTTMSWIEDCGFGPCACGR